MAHFVYPAANPQPATAYPTVQTAYVAAAPQAAYATAAPRAAQAYDSYQTAHATPQYAYTTRTQVAVTVSIMFTFLLFWPVSRVEEEFLPSFVVVK